MDGDVSVRRFAWVLGTAVTLFVLLAAAVLASNDVDRLDVRFVGWVGRVAPEGLVETMRVLTYAGSGVVLALVALGTALLLMRTPYRGYGAIVVAAMVAGLVVTQVLKAVIRRARPEFDEPYVQLTTYAFPSGHALAATATYGALALVAYWTVRSPRRRALLIAGLLATVLVVSASRVVLGAHYLLDVLAGIAAGVAVVSALVIAFAVAPRRRPWLGRARGDEKPQSPRLDA